MNRKETKGGKENANVRPQHSVHARNLRVLTNSINSTRRRVKPCDYTKVLLRDIGEKATAIYSSRNRSRANHYMEFRTGYHAGHYYSVSKLSKIIAQL